MRRIFVPLAVIALSAGALIGAQPAGAGVTYVTAQINGSGSTWAQNAIQQWISDVHSQKLSVVFSGEGSAQGRTDFRNGTTDFAVSDIGFQGFDPSNDTNDTSCQNINPLGKCRKYVYLPIVAGGTSFPYQIREGGQLVRNLRLSGRTLALIFTNQIKNWDDPRIRADNNGRRLPDLAITPVLDSQGSGTSWQFSNYLATEFRQYWRSFAGISGASEYFPRKGSAVSEAGSDSIINYVMSAAGNGAIGYDEYSFALQNNWPVANVENSAHYFTAPTQYNVAVALTKAQINMQKSSKDYLLQKLSKVYTNPDPRTYPLSSYSYMILPVSPNDPRMGRTAAPKAQTAALFIDHDVCGGQAEMGPIGYSPLPVNLAQASFAQMYKLHSADPKVKINKLNVATKCHNPTFWAGHSLSANYLAHIAPYPPSCDKAGQGPCAPGSGVGPTGNPQHGKAPGPTGGSTTSPGSTSSSGPASGSASPSSSSSGGAGLPGGATTSGTGLPGSTTTTGQGSAGSPTNLAASESTSYVGLLAALAAAEVLLLLALPPFLARRRQQGGTGRRHLWRIGR